jgi:Ca-activated chloride channel family protein
MKLGKDSWDWFSLEWFRWSTLIEFQWANKNFLYLIALIPILFFLKWVLQTQFRNKLILAFPADQADLLKNNIIRHIPFIFLSISIALILTSLARPQRVSTHSETYVEGIDILLLMDISESMNITDLKPNRLQAAQEVAINFVDHRPDDRIGLIVFGSAAFAVSPITTDHKFVKQWLKEIETDLMEGSGTAIGTAIATGINYLRDSDSKSKIMILLSDGENTEGTISPTLAAKLAQKFDIKIYTIAIGSTGLVQYKDPKNGKIFSVESHLDEYTLKQIADISEGTFYKVRNKEELGEVFLQIDHLYKSPHALIGEIELEDFYQPYLIWAILFFLSWLFSKNTFLTSSLED